MDGHPFTCLPHEAQCVIALDQPIHVGSRDSVRDALAHGADLADVAHYQHAATRRGAAQLLRAQGAGNTVVLRGPDRAPQWPPGFVGSMTHTASFAAVAVLRESMARSVGIDVEAELAADQQLLVRQYCLVDNEWDALVKGAPSLSEAQLLTLSFSAKEAVFKCLYPLVKRYFDFTCVRIFAVDEAMNLLSIQVLDAEIARCADASVLTGSFQFAEGHVFTSFRLPPA